MPDLNQVFLAGNLTRDPEVRYTPSGDAVGDLQLAVNRRYRTRDGQDHEETCYVGVVVWGRQAETCRDYLSKGSPVLVEGRLQYDQWEKDGQKFSRLRVRAIRVQFLGTPRQANYQDGGAPAGGPPAGQPTPPHGGSNQFGSADTGGGRPAPPVSSDEMGDDDNLPF